MLFQSYRMISLSDVQTAISTDQCIKKDIVWIRFLWPPIKLNKLVGLQTLQ